MVEGKHDSRLDTEPGRQALVDAALRLAQGTPLAPRAYERGLLQAFVRGYLTLAQVQQRLEPAP